MTQKGCDYCKGVFTGNDYRDMGDAKYDLHSPVHITMGIDGNYKKPYIIVEASTTYDILMSMCIDINYCPMCGTKLKGDVQNGN